MHLFHQNGIILIGLCRQYDLRDNLNISSITGAGADAAVMLLLYNLYKSQVKEAELVKVWYPYFKH